MERRELVRRTGEFLLRNRIRDQQEAQRGWDGLRPVSKNVGESLQPGT